MTLIIDIAIVAIVLIFVLVGLKRGFVLTLLPLLSIVLAIVLGFALKAPVRSLLDKTSLEEKITASVTGIIEKSTDKAISGNDDGGERSMDSLSDAEKEEVEKSTGFPKYVSDAVRDWIEKTEGEIIGHEAAAKAAAKVASFAVDLIAFLIIVVIVILVLIIIKLIAKGTRRLNIPVLHQLDSFGGAILGFVLGVAVLYGLTFLLGVFASCGYLTGFASLVKRSFLGGFIYNRNLLGTLVSLIRNKF